MRVAALWLALAQGALAATVHVVQWSAAEGTTRVVIETGEKVRFRAVRLKAPERIYIDLYGAALAAGAARQIAVENPLLRRIRVGEAQPGTVRVVLDLAGAAEFGTTQEPGRVVVELRGPGVNAAEAFQRGLKYDNGGDYAEAARWYRIAAGQGDARAQVNLGVMYQDGQGVPRDAAEAVKWYRLAAAQGDAKAQFNLAVIYENGEGAPRDLAEAARWHRAAAEQGVAKAQSTLGYFYQSGTGVARDAAEAVKWYREAAEQGEPRAQFNLAVMCHNGEGTARDPVEAWVWFARAAAQGFEKAAANRDLVGRELTAGELAEAQRRAQ